MAVYYVASKLSFVACKSRCISQRRKQKNSTNDKHELNLDDAESNWTHKEVSEGKTIKFKLFFIQAIIQTVSM